MSIFAGSGDLVPHAVAAAKAAGYKVQVLTLTSRTDLAGVKVVAADIANPLGIIWSLKIFRTSHIILAGGIHLPDKARQDLIRFAQGLDTADAAAVPVGDAALAGLGSVLKKMTGAQLVGIEEIAPELLANRGLMCGPEFNANIEPSLAQALETAKAIGALDIGQAVVLSGMRVIAVEDIGGTDALIARVGELVRDGLAGDGSTPLVLAKAMKPQQPAFADLPAIGPTTIENCARNGISIVAVEAGHSLVINRTGVAEYADRHGVTVVGMPLNHG
ncbi:LpxI family protein [Devosia rhodophyticola]|uniref:LpxI family protein n=1 Tax=Devosia rhodophyticola TaxID=3026423 RepID=A0ABY7YXE1_9HYPH|nr:LpxI family protein [Devosia rhodophyticola]WDR05897.1 LpxI family protein [Devosia rhodophyticola]